MKGRAWLLCLPLLGACAAHAPEPAARELGITGGVADSQDKAVFLLVEHASPFYGSCTATLIAPNLLLTAHHCVVGQTGGGSVMCGVTAFGAPIAPSSFETTNDQSAATATSAYGALRIDVPPGGDGCGYDMALITLNANVAASVATPAVPRIDLRTTQGEGYLAVGYGQDALGNAGDRNQLAGRTVVCTPGSCGPGTASSEFVGGDGVCEGDSGSPALDSDGKVFGVLSRGESGCASPVYGSVAAWRDWIIQVAEQAAQTGGYAPPFWTNGQSDPVASGGSAGSSGSGGSSGSAAGGASSEQGSVCMAQTDCSAGFHCFSPTGQTSNAFCAADCGSAACASGLVCDANSHVCLPSVAAMRDSSACALRGPHRAGGSLGALGLLGLAVLWRRRRQLGR